MDEARKQRSDSASAAIRAMENAARPPLRPPRHYKLRPQDRPYWKSIIASKARDEWSPVELLLAAQLARCQADYAAEEELLQSEQFVETGPKGTTVVNARCTVLDVLSKRELSLMRALRLAGVTLGAIRDEAHQRVLERTSHDLRESLIEDEGLLAR